MDNAHQLDVVMPIYNFIQYSGNYLKASGTFGNITEINQMII